MINRIKRFMSGRYKIDNLYWFLCIIFIILFFINNFVNSLIINIFELLILIVMFYRILSKDTYKRNRENSKYLRIRDDFISILKGRKKRKGYNDYIYKKCHHCGVKLKFPLPSARGIKHNVCPKCKKKNTFIILRKVKIEFIK